MEYERIDKVQTGILSPSKLRVTLFGSPQRRKVEGKRSCSSSPIKSKDAASACALLAEEQEFSDEVDLKSSEGTCGTEVNLGNNPSVVSNGSFQDSRSADPLVIQQPTLKESTPSHSKMKSVPECVVPNLSINMVYPIKPTEENVDYVESEREGSAPCGFEFYKPDNSLHTSVTMAFSRPLPSKWNDAEKWLVSKQPVRTNHSRRISACIQANRAAGNNATRVTDQEMAEQRLSVLQVVNVKKNNSCLPEIGDGSEKFRFAGFVTDQVPGRKPSVNIEKPSSYPIAISKCMGPLDPSNVQKHPSGVTSISMRDMGTEMTPTVSQEPSRTGTPAMATTPVLSPDPSLPSTPRKDTINVTSSSSESPDTMKEQQYCTGKAETSEREVKLKTRREIKDLGMQLGKISIAAWASQQEDEKEAIPTTPMERPADPPKVVFESRAAKWLESKKAKHDARYQHEIVKIQAWENHIKAKAEAEMRRIQVKLEHMTACTQERILHRLTSARLQAEARHKVALAKRDRWSVKVVQQAEQVRQTGRIPWSCFSCYSGN